MKKDIPSSTKMTVRVYMPLFLMKINNKILYRSVGFLASTLLMGMWFAYSGAMSPSSAISFIVIMCLFYLISYVSIGFLSKNTLEHKPKRYMTNQEALREFVLIASENGCHRDKWSIKRKGTNDVYHPGPLYYETAKQACDIDDSLYCEPVSVDTCIVWSKRYWKAAAGFALQGTEKMPSRKDYMIRMVESDNEREVVKLFVSNKRDIKDLIHF